MPSGMEVVAMSSLIRAALNHSRGVTVIVLTVVVLGGISIVALPIDILPVFKSPAVQVLTFYNGMPASSIEKDITSRMERWTGQAPGTKWQESRSILGASIVRAHYFENIDAN